MDTVESQLAFFKAQFEVQATQISRLNADLSKIRAGIPWPPLEKFDLFPQLPVELRHQIWRYALRSARLLTIVQAPGRPIKWQVGVDDDDDYVKIRLVETNSVPHSKAFFTVCKESRDIALSTHANCLSYAITPTMQRTYVRWRNRNGYTGVAEDSPKPTFGKCQDSVCDGEAICHEAITFAGFRFQPTYDTIYLKTAGYPGMWSIISNEFAEAELGNIRSVAVDWFTMEQLDDEQFFFGGNCSTYFHGLEELIIVAMEDRDAVEEGLEDYGITAAQENVKERRRQVVIEWGRDTQIPIWRVMTETMLAEYVSKNGRHAIQQDPRFLPIE
jgi:hypothetical protein